MVVTIATSATIACGDAAVDPVTAPELAAKPATPVAAQYPYLWDFATYEIPTNALGMQIAASPRFEDDYHTFVVSARVTFQWANQVSANIDAWLLNKNGQTVNKGSAGMTYTRLALPVPQGDTTFTVRISTNNITCGLVGKASYSGSAALVALDARLVQLTLTSHTIHPTTTFDVPQPDCPPPSGCEQEPVTRVIGAATGVLASTTTTCDNPMLPPGSGSEEWEVCFTVWRELWVWDYLSRSYTLSTEWIVGVICYLTTAT